MFLRILGLFFVVFLAGLGCGKLQSALEGAEKIPERMKETNKNLEKTSEGLRLATLNESQKNMLSPEVRSQLYPVPTGLMPSAKVFGDKALSSELVALTSLWLTRIDKIERLPKFDVNGNEVPLTSDEKYEDLVERFQYLQALSAIAGQAPQAKIEEIVLTYIQAPSQYYREAALNFIMLRAYFLRAVMIGERHLSRDLTGSGDAQLLIESQRFVDWILDQPFASALYVKTRGLNAPANYTRIQNLDLKMDLDTKKWLAEPWAQVESQLEQVLKISVRQDTGNATKDQSNFEKELKDIETLLAEAKIATKKWSETLK